MRDGWVRSVEDLIAEAHHTHEGGHGARYESAGDEYELPADDPRREELTQIVVLRGRVIDVRQEPVSGSGYECAALELEHVLPRPAPRVERVVVHEQPHEQMIDWLRRVVGGEQALDALDDRPLPASPPIDTGAMTPEVRDLVQAVEEQLERISGGWLVADEMLTACRRVLVAAESSGTLRLWRDLEPDKIAAAVVHCTAKANALVGTGSPFTVAHWLRDLGTTSAPSSRSARLAMTIGGAQWPHGRRPPQSPDVYVLGDPALLVGRFRRELLGYRGLAERIRPR